MKIKYFLQTTLLILSGYFFSSCEPAESLTLDEEISVIENSLTTAGKRWGTNSKLSIADRMQYRKVLGFSIAIVRQGKIRWAKGYGKANTAKGSSVNPNTIFQAGSISKPVAALAALLLVEQDCVDLDADVNTYLTNWKRK